MGFFRSRAFFPPALRCAPPSIGWYSGVDGTWERFGWVRKVEEADDGTTGGNGMADPRFEEEHPNHSSSYVDFVRFFSIFAMLTIAFGGNS